MHDETQDNHRKAVRKIFKQVWTHANFEDVDHLVAENALFHFGNQTLPSGPEDLRKVVLGWHQRFADFRMDILEMVAEADLVAVRLMLSGRHLAQQGEESPTTGKEIAVTVMMFLRFEAGRVVEIWENYDEYGLRQQLQAQEGD